MTAFVLLATVAAPAVLADTEAQATNTAEQSAASDKGNELVCRREPVMGTHMQRKVCRTRTEMEAQRAEAQAGMRELRNQSGYSRGEAGQ